MSELQGACLLAQLEKLDGILEKCRAYHSTLRKHMEKYPQIKIRYEEGDCGIAFIMLMESEEQAKQFNDAMIAEGIPCGPTSFCPNLLENEPISSRAVIHPNLPPFGAGFAGEHVVYDAKTQCLNTNRYLNGFVAIVIGPLDTESEIDDIKKSLDKVLPKILRS